MEESVIASGAVMCTPKRKKDLPLRLPLGALKAPHTWLHRRTLSLRTALREAVLAHAGFLGPEQEAKINTACHAQRQASRIEKILADGGEPGSMTLGTSTKVDGAAQAITTKQVGLSHEQWLSFHNALLRSLETRDRAIGALDLKPKTILDDYDRVMAEARTRIPPPAAPSPARHQ
jgi:hypothetical protein